MKIKKVIKFEYYRVVYREKGQKDNTSDKLYDLREWIQAIQPVSIEERVAKYYSDFVKAERLCFEDKSKYWFIQFSRMRESNLPTKTKIKEISKPMALEEDEFIGEEVIALYDDKTFVLMVQRNRASVSPSAIEDYLNYLVVKLNPEYNKRIYLRPMMWESNTDKIKKAKCHRKLFVKFADLKKDFKGNSAITGIINELKKYQPVCGEIIISMGHSGNKESLEQDEIIASINDIKSLDNKSIVSTARISSKYCDDTKVELIDLFEDKIHDLIEIGIDEKRSLLLEDLMEPMSKMYNQRKAEIIKKVLPEE